MEQGERGDRLSSILVLTCVLRGVYRCLRSGGKGTEQTCEETTIEDDFE